MGRFAPLDDGDESEDGEGATPPAIRSSSNVSDDADTQAGRDDDDGGFGVSTKQAMRQLERIEELTEENALARTETSRIKAENETLLQELERLREESEQKRSTNDAAEWRVRELENDKQEKDAEIEMLKRQLTRKDQDTKKMQDELDVLRSKAKKADAAERARRGFEDQMRRMEQKMQQHAEVKVKLNAMEQERDGLQQQRADLQEKLRRSDDKLRKVTAERDQVERDLAAASGQVRSSFGLLLHLLCLHLTALYPTEPGCLLRVLLVLCCCRLATCYSTRAMRLLVR
jgi:chromosome segregation ATPase